MSMYWNWKNKKNIHLVQSAGTNFCTARALCFTTVLLFPPFRSSCLFVCLFVYLDKTRKSILCSLCLEGSNNPWEWLHTDSGDVVQKLIRHRPGRVTSVTALRNSTALTKIEAQVSFSTRNLTYLFFFRGFFFNLGSCVP